MVERKISKLVSVNFRLGVIMSALGGSALVGGVVFAKELWHYWKPRKVGVYGPTMVGKTTLDRYMTTPGEMEEIPIGERTKHFKVPGINRFLLPRPSRKRVTYRRYKSSLFF